MDDSYWPVRARGPTNTIDPLLPVEKRESGLSTLGTSQTLSSS